MDYHCTACNKKYKSYQSLWNHNHKYHNTQNPQTSSSLPQTSSSKLTNSSDKLSDKHIKKLTCDFCEKIFSRIDNLKRHKLKCDKNKSDKLDQIKEELREELKKEFQVEINKLKKPTTNIKVHGNIIGTNTDNGPKQVIYKTGTEDMNQITYDEVSTIFDNEISSVIKLIDLVNFSETKPQNHSFCSTALESPYLSFYNTDTNSINKERKRYFFEEVVCKSIQNHEILYSKFKNKFNSVKRKKIEDNIANLKKMKENSFSSKIMDELIRNLNLLSYNKRNLIQETWCADQAKGLRPIATLSRSGKKYDNDSDEEFMAMLLNDPETQKILEANKKLTDNLNSSKESSDDDKSTDSSEDDSDSERPDILPQYAKSTKSKSNKTIDV